MPTLLFDQGFRFFFYSDEHDPLHVHVEYGGAEARIELGTGKATLSTLKPKDLQKAIGWACKHHQQFTLAWHEHFRKNHRQDN